MCDTNISRFPSLEDSLHNCISSSLYSRARNYYSCVEEDDVDKTTNHSQLNNLEENKESVQNADEEIKVKYEGLRLSNYGDIDMSSYDLDTDDMV